MFSGSKNPHFFSRKIIFSNKSILNLNTLIVFISLSLFLVRLYICHKISPNFYSMDFYGYIELAKNIFHKFDFKVFWLIGVPLRYPPFFSILIYIASFLTHDFIASIKWVNVFCVSFYLVPLYFLVKNILNVPSSLLAVVFTTCYFALDSCFQLRADFFYSFLIMIVAWLLWEILTHHEQKAGYYVLTGFLISLAYLTKYAGIFFGVASIASILYYFGRHRQNLRIGFKMSAFVMLGAAPLLLGYHLLLSTPAYKKIPSISSFAFFDGNFLYKFRGDLKYRDYALYSLNAEETEFSYVSFLKTHHVSDSFLKQPLFLIKKYVWGLQVMIRDITSEILPWRNSVKPDRSLWTQGLFLLLLAASGFYFKWPFKMMHILFFAAGLILIPFLYVSSRYLIPYMPFYFILWIFILNAGYRWLNAFLRNKLFFKMVAAAIVIALGTSYAIKGYKESRQIDVAKFKSQEDRWKRTASWIKEDSKTYPHRLKIMVKPNYLAYLTGSEFISPPVVPDWNKIIRFAALKNVHYVVAEGIDLNSPRFLVHEFRPSFSPEALVRAIEKRSGMPMPQAASSIEVLNELLKNSTLYKFMPRWPHGSMDFIQKLRRQELLAPSELERLNRLLIEANYPEETPSKGSLLLQLNHLGVEDGNPVKMGWVESFHEIPAEIGNVLILKMKPERTS